MYAHDESKLIFLANPRTASTAVAGALMGIGFEKIGKHHEDYKMGEAWTTFAAVRNHWDAALSWVLAHNFPMSVESLERALDNEYITTHEMWVYHKLDITMRYEQLGLWLNFILSCSGLPLIKLNKQNVSANRNGKHYREFYTPETRQYIYDRFEDEIVRMGYKYE